MLLGLVTAIILSFDNSVTIMSYLLVIEKKKD